MVSTQGVTEFGYVTLRKGIEGEVLAANTAVGKVTQHTMATALQQPGAREAHYGTSIEHPTQLWLFLDWDTVEDHMAYRKTEINAAITKELTPLMDATGGAGFAHIVPPLSAAFANPVAPIVEILIIAFPSDLDQSTKEVVTEQLQQFIKKALLQPGLCSPPLLGWAMENDIPVMGRPEQKGCMAVAAIPWPSIEKHMENRELQEFKDNRHLLLNLPRKIQMDMFHVACTSEYAQRSS